MKSLYIFTALLFCFSFFSTDSHADTSWQGVYLGLVAESAQMSEKPSNPTPRAVVSSQESSWGVRVGYNGATLDPRVIWGVEVAIDSSLSGSSCGYCEEYPPSTIKTTFGPTLDLRGKIGMTFLDEALLVYGLAGISATEAERTHGATFSPAEWYKDTEKRYAAGTMVGAGVSYKMSDRCRLGVEYTRRFLDEYEVLYSSSYNSGSFESEIDSRTWGIRLDILL